ncbi:MAG TPA: DNA-binding response regulator, partial [Clostridiales bacterium]|nr:DNA-binding response regulator [Clostridiales bacterium]
MQYRILVCDDDPAIARAIGIYLRAAGYEALEAHDGPEALDLCARKSVHLVIMDIM